MPGSSPGMMVRAVGWVELFAKPISNVNGSGGFRKGSTHPTIPELMHAHLSGFPAQHRLLAGDAPVIAGQCAAFAEGAMAGHHERHGVLADRRTDCAWRLGAPDARRNGGIGHRT